MPSFIYLALITPLVQNILWIFHFGLRTPVCLPLVAKTHMQKKYTCPSHNISTNGYAMMLSTVDAAVSMVSCDNKVGKGTMTGRPRMDQFRKGNPPLH